MGLKLILGVLLLIIGLGAGVYDWLRSGFTSPVPFAGIALCFLGAYLIYSDLKSRRARKTKTVDKTLVDISALIAGTVAGILAVEELKKRLSSEKPGEATVARSQIAEWERQLEEMRAQGRVSPEKYLEIKRMLEELKRTSGYAR